MSGYLDFFDPGMPWYVMAIMATFIAIMIHAILAALGKSFALYELEKYAHSEMLQAGATLIMVIFVFSMVFAVQEFAVNYFLGGGGVVQLPCGGGPRVDVDSMEDSLDLLRCRMAERAEIFAELQDDSIESAGGALFLQSMYTTLFGIPVIQGAYFGEIYKQIETYRIMINLSTNMLVATNTLLVFTNYVKNNMLSFFLPLGLLLRSFHFTRGIGAFFMSIAIGFYFIFPIFYIITDPAYVRPTGYNTPPPLAIDEALWCHPTFSGVVHQLTASPVASGAGSEMVSLDALKSDLSRVYFAVILHPFIIFSITLMFVRQFMYLLGGEAQDLLRMVSKVI